MSLMAYTVAVTYADGDDFTKTYSTNVDVQAGGHPEAKLAAMQMVAAIRDDAIHIQIQATKIVDVKDITE